MPADAERAAETREWLVRARQDLRAADVLLGAPTPLADVAMFHCQQAAEKALKAFLAWHEVPFRKTHDIEEIGLSCRQRDETLAALVDRAIDLTPFAWRFRYPGSIDVPPPDEARDARALAGAVYEAVAGRLPPEARP